MNEQISNIATFLFTNMEGSTRLWEEQPDYDLLSEKEKTLLCRLSVFAGGWTLEAAEKACSDDAVIAAPSPGLAASMPPDPASAISEQELLGLLSSLVDKNLVVFDERAGRYRLLETVRQYAGERLSESGNDDESDGIRRRHLDYLLVLAEEAEPHLKGAEQQAWLERLETEHDNLRAALGFALLLPTDSGLRLAAAAWWLWYVRGYLGEGRRRLAAMLGSASAHEHTERRAMALNGAGVLAYNQGDYAPARALYEESLAIRREAGDRRGVAGSLCNLGNVAHVQGDYASARALYEESVAVFRELGDRQGVAGSLCNLGSVADDQGDYTSARALYEESVAVFRELGDRRGVAMSLDNLGIVADRQGDRGSARALHEESLAIRRDLRDLRGAAISLHNLGIVALEQGDHATARALHEESLAIRRELGDRWGVAFSLEGIAAVASALSGPDRAASIWGSAERLREGIGSPVTSRERSDYDRLIAGARAALGDDAAFDRAWQEGREMTLVQAIEYALEETDLP